MFITGPTKCGKSVLLRQTLNDFAEKGQHNPVVFHFDFDDSVNSMMTFDVFLQKFENMIVNTIVENQRTIQFKTHKQIFGMISWNRDILIFKTK